MVGASLVALSTLWNLALVPAKTGAPAGSSVLSASPSAVTPRLAMPRFSMKRVSMPKVSMPRLHRPHLPKRSGSTDALVITARRLTALVADQESWYADHGRYGTNPYAMARKATRADSAFDKVQVQVLYAGSKGWTALASHPDAPGKNCVIYVGYRTALPLVPRTRADAVDAAAEGRPACDR